MVGRAQDIGEEVISIEWEGTANGGWNTNSMKRVTQNVPPLGRAVMTKVDVLKQEVWTIGVPQSLPRAQEHQVPSTDLRPSHSASPLFYVMLWVSYINTVFMSSPPLPFRHQFLLSSPTPSQIHSLLFINSIVKYMYLYIQMYVYIYVFKNSN